MSGIDLKGIDSKTASPFPEEPREPKRVLESLPPDLPPGTYTITTEAARNLIKMPPAETEAAVPWPDILIDAANRIAAPYATAFAATDEHDIWRTPPLMEAAAAKTLAAQLQALGIEARSRRIPVAAPSGHEAVMLVVELRVDKMVPPLKIKLTKLAEFLRGALIKERP